MSRDTVVRNLLLFAVLTFFLLPLAWTGMAAFGLLPDNGTRPSSLKGPITFDHFREIGIAEPAFWQELTTSTAAAACATILAITCSFLAAFGLVRSRFGGKALLTEGFLVLASLPGMAYVIPLSDLMRRAHLVDTFAGVVLTEAAVLAPLAVYVLHGALRQLSAEWEEAAVLDGAGLFQILSKVVWPQAAPSVAATAIVIFVLAWNLLLIPLVLTSGEIKTVPVAMMDFFTFERELDWPTAAAALVVSLVPVAILVGIFHRVLERFSLEAGQGGPTAQSAETSDD